MGDAQRDILHSQLHRNFPRLTRQRQRRPPALLPHHFQIHPPHPAPPPRPQRLHRRLFRCKPSRIPLILILELLAIGSLLRRINPLQKYLPMPLNGPLNPSHLRNVHAHPYDQMALSESAWLGPGFSPAGLLSWRVFRPVSFSRSSISAAHTTEIILISLWLPRKH